MVHPDKVRAWDDRTSPPVIRAPLSKIRLLTEPFPAQHVSDAKVNYKQLAGGVEFVDAIPKNPSGKLLRRFLRDRAKEMQAAGRLSRPATSRAKL